jgi:hypothetical protein
MVNKQFCEPQCAAYLIGWVDREASGKGQAAVRGASRAFKLANAHSGGGVKGTSRHLRQGIKYVRQAF